MGYNGTLNIVAQQTERITKIIQQLLGFARRKKTEQTPVNISTLLEIILNLLESQIRTQKIIVTKNYSNNLPSIIGDPEQLQQVFLNLILNAIQSMPKGGRFCVSASPKCISKQGLEDSERKYMEICVEDTGVGMEKDVLQNIFNPLFTTKDSGTGLGLMVTQGIVQDHEGWIEVKSEVRKGTVFKVYLPCIEGEVRGEG